MGIILTAPLICLMHSKRISGKTTSVNKEGLPMLGQKAAITLVQKYLERLPIKVEEAILFGSTATNTRLAESDIDPIVISEDFKQMAMPQRFLVLQKNWRLKTDLEAFGFTKEEFDSLKNKSIVLQEAVEYGIKLEIKNSKNKPKLALTNSPAL